MAMLRQGGSAVDAAIATALVLGLVEPQSSGLGGGAFLLHYDGETRGVAAYDGRETAPRSADETLFLKPDGTPMAFWDAVIRSEEHTSELQSLMRTSYAVFIMKIKKHMKS